MLFVRLPGGKVFVPTCDPPKVEIGPFLIAKQGNQAAWKNILRRIPASALEGLPYSERLGVDPISVQTCQKFCTTVSLSLPTDAQLEHACDRLAIPDLKRYIDSSRASSPALQKFVVAGFHPVFNLVGPERARRAVIGPGNGM